MNKAHFLDKVVFGYIKKDLETIKFNIPPKMGEVGNANFPIALCVLSYMEYLGSFFANLERDFFENVSAYIEKCFNNKNEYHVGILRDIFRNGLAHEYFARGGVSRGGVRPGLYRGENGEVILDADTMLEDFLASLDVFKEKLDEQKLVSRLKLAEDSIRDNEDRYKVEIENLPSIKAIPDIKSSGASIYAGTLNFTRPYDPNEG